MATRSVSPGGALLRASRLFSVPAPLPRPTPERSSTAAYNSETATLPHPIHLTITTPPSSLSKGDWGLKRPLPLRSTTKTSTPLIRVESVDTLEHITEYASAADHTLTLQKWQELNMPLTTPGSKEQGMGYMYGRVTPGRGVFDEYLDNGHTGQPHERSEEIRWKFRGPWLAGLTVNEFNDFIKKTIRTRKAEFQTFLRETKAMEDTKAAQLRAADQGEDSPAPVKASDITDGQLTNYNKELRQDRASLFRLIRLFLDLPPAPSSKGLLARMEDAMDSLGSDGPGSKTPTINSEDYLPKSDSPYADSGPPKTHPSAGLSYLRSNSFLFNHPVYGPQERPPPVEGRVVMPKVATAGNFVPKLGVAGVVTDAPSGDGFSTSNAGRSRNNGSRRTYPGLLNVEPDRVGGSKIYLHPTAASIDPTGRISLQVVSGEGPALAVMKGQVDPVSPPVDVSTRNDRLSHIPANTTPQGYGLGPRSLFTENQRAVDDKRLSGKQAAPSEENDAMKMLRTLLAETDDRY